VVRRVLHADRSVEDSCRDQRSCVHAKLGPVCFELYSQEQCHKHGFERTSIVWIRRCVQNCSWCCAVEVLGG
jgi:hypothetical protein